MNHIPNKAINDLGGTGDVIILIHGYLATSKYWTKLRPYLSNAGYRVITLDLLGFGHAPKPRDADYSYDQHVTHISTLIDSLHLQQPFVLVGHSMGALLATRYCLTHPERVRSLTLLHPPLYNDAEQARATLRSTSVLYRYLLDSRFRRLGWIIIKLYAHYRLGSHSRVARERSLVTIIEAAEMLNDAVQLQTKTLLVMGLKDRVEYSQNVHAFEENTNLTLVWENVSHHSPIKNPTLIQQTILNFIR